MYAYGKSHGSCTSRTSCYASNDRDRKCSSSVVRGSWRPETAATSVNVVWQRLPRAFDFTDPKMPKFSTPYRTLLRPPFWTKMHEIAWKYPYKWRENGLSCKTRNSSQPLQTDRSCQLLTSNMLYNKSTTDGSNGVWASEHYGRRTGSKLQYLRGIDRRKCGKQTRPSTSFDENTIDLPWQNCLGPEFGTKFQTEVNLFRGCPNFFITQWKEASGQRSSRSVQSFWCNTGLWQTGRHTAARQHIFRASKALRDKNG